MQHRLAPVSKARGFTLIEVLVALVVMAILAGLSWQAVDGMVRTRNSIEDQSQRMGVLTTAMAQWEVDLQGLLSEGPVPSIHFDGARLRLVRRAPQGAQLVVWSLRQGVWQRWASIPTSTETELAQAWAQVPQMTGTEPGHLTLAEGVAGWQLYFYRGNAWTNAQSSGDLVAAGVAASVVASQPGAGSRGVPNRERLPQGVRLMLNLRGSGDAGNLVRDVLVSGGQP